MPSTDSKFQPYSNPGAAIGLAPIRKGKRGEVPVMSRGPSYDVKIFAAALARPVQDRAAFLDGACHGDAELRARILALLAAHAGGDSLLAGAPNQL